MKLAVGALGLPGAHTGMGTFASNVTPRLLELHPDARAYTLHPPFAEQFPGRVSLLGRQPFRKGWRGILTRLFAYQIALRRRVQQDGALVFYNADHEGMLFPPFPQVVTLMDLIPLHYRNAHAKLRRFFQIFFPMILRGSRGVVCISEATKRDLLARYNLAPERVCVALLGCDPSLFHPRTERLVYQRTGLERYFLFVGSTAPHKNVRRIIEALARLPDRNCRLVLIGTKDPRTWPELEAAIGRLGLRDRVVSPGNITREELPCWYSESLALVFPSLYEGFGLPALEAMACGCPVISSNVSSLPEVCGEAALYVEPHDIGSISAAMQRVLDEAGLAESLRARGIERAATFTWDRTARTISDFLAGPHVSA